MEIDIVTKKDLQEFRLQLLQDLKELLAKDDKSKNEWLRSSEVRKMLKISPGTLQNLRIAGVLRSSKVGGMHYYKFEDITKVLKNSK